MVPSGEKATTLFPVRLIVLRVFVNCPVLTFQSSISFGPDGAPESANVFPSGEKARVVTANITVGKDSTME
jgi:hypothetical protein